MDSTAASQAPLLQRQLDDTMVEVGAQQNHFQALSGRLQVREFLFAAETLAQQLPQHEFVINLCENRLAFMLSFCAVLLRGQTNLLPQNRGLATQEYLHRRYKNVYVLHDGVEVATGISELDLRTVQFAKGSAEKIPEISLSHLAAIAFTSGSTGEPQPNIKTWHTFVRSSEINASYMLPSTQQTLFELATVPGQHMWGLETSILIPMMNNVCISDSKPLMPQDVQRALQRINAPRVMVSTPVHLRALVLSGLDFPTVERILCATAPLTEQLAIETETVFQGELHEVFGCSEVGSMAIRRTAQTQVWQLFEGLNMNKNAVEECHEIRAEHLPAAVTLQDQIEQMDTRQFRLLGRGNDMLEIAGKRGSLQEMNKILLSAPDVMDGVIFFPTDDFPSTEKHKTQRLAAIVAFQKSETDKEQQKKQLLHYFRQRLDPVFIPRPLYVVDALPREENGKLPRSKLLSFYQNIRTERAY